MPELPEVETVRRLLTTKIIGSKITNVRLMYNKIIKTPSIDEFKKQIIGQTIYRVERIAKHLIFVLDDYALICHLRMEGKYFVNQSGTAGDFKHILIVFEFEGGNELRYHDTRRFGTFHLLNKTNFLKFPPLAKVGYEPFATQMTPHYLQKMWSRKTIAIKSALLEQSIIAGIGNIYANEILFACRISPFRATNSLTLADLKLLINQSRLILRQAIQAGGTTIFSFQAAPGIDGKFTSQLKVHGRVNLSCLVCHTTIQKHKLNGRGTYYCPHCQYVS